jgi:hypothetical protein
MAAATKQEKKKLTLGRPALVVGTNLEQSILETFDIYGCATPDLDDQQTHLCTG